MFQPLRDLVSGKAKTKGPRLPDGMRAYVIGDIHGRLDLFDALIDAIEADDAESGAADSQVILLGDLIDRGPESAGVVKRARKWSKKRTVHTLIGNHEEMLLESLKDTKVLRHFLKHGGRETILSYGIEKKAFNRMSLDELQLAMRDAIPAKHIAFIETFEDKIELGDYLFVHAGIDPHRSVEEQRSRDMRWIREPFLNHRERHSHMVVHGHTIFEEVDERRNRIGIDTGAYRFGRLTALVLEGTTRRYIQSVEKKSGAIVIKHRDRLK